MNLFLQLKKRLLKYFSWHFWCGVTCAYVHVYQIQFNPSIINDPSIYVISYYKKWHFLSSLGFTTFCDAAIKSSYYILSFTTIKKEIWFYSFNFLSPTISLISYKNAPKKSMHNLPKLLNGWEKLSIKNKYF